MNPPTLLASFALLVLAGVSYTHNTPLWQVPAEGRAMIASATEVVPELVDKAGQKLDNGIFLASHRHDLPQGVTRLP